MAETLLGKAPGSNPLSLTNNEHVAIISGQPLPFLIPRGPLVSLATYSPEMIGNEIRAWGFSFASQTYPVANTAFYIPFGLPFPVTVKQLFSFNGATISTGNVDIGIYDAAGNRKINKGTTASSGTNTIQIYDITDTLLPPGRYYMAFASDSSNVNQKIFMASLTNAGSGTTMGIYEQTTAFTLPTTATFATLTQTLIPIIGLTYAATI